MSNDTNYVRVGFVTVAKELNDSVRVSVGIRTDIWRVVVHNGSGKFPDLTDAEARQVGQLLTKAAAVLPDIMNAHSRYQAAAAAALQAFEDAARAVDVGVEK